MGTIGTLFLSGIGVSFLAFALALAWVTYKS